MTMNEHQVENLLSQHGDEIMARRQPKVVKRRVAWKPILVTGTAVVATATFLLLPMNAEAAKIVKIKNAMKHVNTSEVTMSASYNGGPWREFSRSITQGKKLRADVAIWQGGELTIISDSKVQWTNFKRLPFATIEPADPTEIKFMTDFVKDPLASAMSALDGNSDPNVYSLKTENLPNGTYVVHYSRNDGGSKRGATTLRIVVDQANDLPMESFQNSKYEWGSQDIHTTYRYGLKLSPQLFEIDRSKKVYVAASERQKLSDQWSKVKPDGTFAPIYSATVTPDGTIWVAYGANDKIDSDNPLVQVPSQLISGSKKYVLAMELPTHYDYDYANVNKDFSVEGKPAVIAAFVPVGDPALDSSDFRMRFGTRKLGENTEQSPEAHSQTLSLKKETMALPEYMICLGWQKEFLRVGTTLWRKKAEAREAIGDLKGAIRAYDAEAKAYENYVIYASYRPILKAADCYEKLGHLEKAKELRAKAAELQKSRIR